jgi:hypothetical protein
MDVCSPHIARKIYLLSVSLMKKQQIGKIFRWRSENIDFAMRSFALRCLVFFHLDACLAPSFDLPAQRSQSRSREDARNIFFVLLEFEWLVKFKIMTTNCMGIKFYSQLNYTQCNHNPSESRKLRALHVKLQHERARLRL